MCNFYSYMRISTKEERGKQGYSRQEKALDTYAKKHHIEFVLQFKEDESGKSFDNRKEWQRLEKIIQPGDTIVFKDLCRFTREAENGYQKYMDLMGRGINLIFIDNPTISTDYIKDMLNIAKSQDLVPREINTFFVKILLLVELDRAEKERVSISQRTKDGMAAKKAQAEARGEKWSAGRKTGQLDKMSPELEADITLYIADRSIRQVDLMKKHNISRNTLKKYIQRMREKEYPDGFEINVGNIELSVETAEII